MPDLTHLENAQENEDLADELDSEIGSQRNWIVTIRFYSLLHYADGRLKEYGYQPERHHERTKAIRDCDYIDSELYKVYRMMYDLSEDSRYKRIRMGMDEVRQSKSKLEQGKELTGFDQSDGGSAKYSTS